MSLTARHLVLVMLLALGPVRAVLASSYVDCGFSYLKSGDLDSAYKSFRTELLYHPRNALAHFGMGNFYLRTGRTNEAAREFQYAVLLDPNGGSGASARRALANLQPGGVQQGNTPPPLKVRPATLPSVTPAGRDFSVATRRPAVRSLPSKPSHALTPKTQLERSADGETIEEQYKQQIGKAKEDFDAAVENIRQAEKELEPSDSEGLAQLEGNKKLAWEDFQLQLYEQEKWYRSQCELLGRSPSPPAAKDKNLNSAGKALPASKRSQAVIACERAVRMKALEEQFQAQQEAVEDQLEAAIAKLSEDQSKKAVGMDSEEQDRLEKHNDDMTRALRLRAVAKIAELKKNYLKRLALLNSTAATLDSYSKSMPGAGVQLIPVGNTNIYSRHFQTFGEPTGNLVPLMAEPKALPASAAK